MLSGLIQQFEHLAVELLAAVAREDEAEVARIDARIQALTDRLFRIRARGCGEMLAQIGFFKRLAQKNSDDGSSVARYTDAMTALFERYMEPGGELKAQGAGPAQVSVQHGYDPSLHELALDCLQERVAIIGLDYRYIYCNKRNAEFHGRSPAEFIGRPLFDVIDMEPFQLRAKPNLDRCFAGASLSYDYEAADSSGRMIAVNCRMTPFAGPDGRTLGALLVVSPHTMFARAS